MTKTKRNEYLARHRQCQKRYRERKKTKDENAVARRSGSSYQARSTLSKAVKRAALGLPASARKRKKVISVLAMQQRIQIAHQVKKGSKERVSGEIKECVTQFFLRDDVSWQAPGQKDCKSNKTNNGTKKKMQKRFLLYTLREAYSMYCEENVINLVGFSKFCSLRPAHVCLVNQLPQTVCVCKYHENVKLLLEPLNNIKSTLPSTCKDFVSAVCNEESEMCMFGKCECCTEKFNSTFDVLFEHYKTQIS